MTDSRIYGKQASHITTDIIAELEKRVGNIGIYADILEEQMHEYITSHNRSDLNFQALCIYAERCFWEGIYEVPVFVEAVEGSDDCIEHIMESLCSTSKSDDFFERVRLLANDFWAR